MSSTNPKPSTAVLDHDKVADQASTYVAKFERRETPLQRFKKFLHHYPIAAPLIVLL